MTAWTDAYVGVPFLAHGRSLQGLDCWGLVKVILELEQGVTVPSYAEDYVSVAERNEIATALTRAGGDPWAKVAEAVPFDIALFRRGALAAHVGVVCGDGMMIHVEEGLDSRIDRYDDGPWANRLIGVFRHRELAL